MSEVPEWMLKFQQIGQRGGEEVTSYDEKGGGAAKFVHKDREYAAATVGETSVAASSVSSVTQPPKEESSKDETKKEEGNDDDAAALFFNAGKADEENLDDDPGQINTVNADEAGADDETVQTSGGESAARAFKGEETKKEEEEADAAAMFFAAGQDNSKKEGEDAPSQQESMAEEESATAPVSEGDMQSAGEAGSAFSPKEDEFIAAAASTSNMQSEGGDTATEGATVMSADGTTTATPEIEGDVGVVESLNAPSDEEMLMDDEEVVWEDELEEEVIEDEEVFVDEYGNIIEEDLDQDEDEVVVEEKLDASDNLPSAASMFGAKSQDPPGATFDIEQQDKAIEKVPKEKKPTEFNPYIAVCACLAVIAAVVVIVLYIILDIDEEDTPRDIKVVRAVPPTSSPTTSPEIPDPAIDDPGAGLDASEATTSFDPMISNDCVFTGLLQPDIYDQCRCGGEILLLAEDVRTRYSDLVKDFIPSVPGGYDGTISSCTPRNQALVWLSAGINNGGDSESARIQRFAMAEFFYEQEGLTWTDSTNWLSNRSVCSWYGITCNEDRIVSKIELGDNNLTGRLSAAVGTMDLVGGLDTFSVSNNNLGGTIPPALFAASIQSIDLSENNFFGNLPPMSDSLVILNVERNSLSGPITELGNAVSLETVKIANNAFNGQLPAALFSRPLQELDLGNNFLAGIIPSEISQATLLKSLRLGPNRFSGALPSNINALTNLESLSIFKIPGLDGRLPGSFGLSLTNLVELIISETLVRGDIPSFFGGLTRLVTLDLSSNLLRSELPRELGLLTRLTTLYLDNNDFNGPIPAELGRLTRLTELLLHNNAITGSIPSELGGLVDLKRLILDGNAFGGVLVRVPDEICSLRDEDLEEFTTDCPVRVGTETAGVICGIPTCCTSCR